MERPPLSSFSRPHRRVVRGLAEALVLGPWRVEDLSLAIKARIGGRGGWVRALAERLIQAFPAGPRPTSARVAAFLSRDERFQARNAQKRLEVSARLGAAVMCPAPGAPERWEVPPLVSPGELAAFLGIGLSELDGFADVQGRGCRVPAGPSRHYDHAWRPKARGAARLIEAPRARLKAIQRKVLDEILAGIPAHQAAHGFRPGRSIVTFAAPHAGRPVVLAMDLRDFFPSVANARVVAIFLTAGYPEPVARRLAGLCVSRVPRDVWEGRPNPTEGPEAWRAGRRLQAPHLPQGAPTSPALANLAAWGLDARLDALAKAAAVRYTRYADDLAFSGGVEFARSWRRFSAHVAAIALEEGFEVNHHKTRVMLRGVRQRLAGVVVNDRPNVARDDVDRLKATLHNCLRHGPESQNQAGHTNFRAHLAGRVAHVAMLNPRRGEALRAMLERIAW